MSKAENQVLYYYGFSPNINFIWVGSGICSDIASSKHEYWSSLAPLPLEIVLSAGQKAKEERWKKGK